MKKIPLILALLPVAFALTATASPATFEQAKVVLREQIYFDRNHIGDTYCGCPWRWVGRSGGRVDLQACGYEVRAQPVRAARTEIEHIVPAWTLGHQRQCWQNGGRKNCVATDPVFRAMEADLHGLTVVVGEVNADRSNFNFGQLSSTPYQYGACRTRVDFKQRTAEPRDEAKGFVARVQFFMHDWYGLNMSRQQQQLFSAWDRMYPPSEWERERERRVARVMGYSNPYVTGERTWSIGQRSSGEGLARLGQEKRPFQREDSRSVSTPPAPQPHAGAVIGNRNSRVFHMPTGCPSYELVAERNRIHFQSAEQAEQAGFRLAGNCR